MNALPIQISQAQFWKTRFQRGYRRGSLSLAAAGGLPCARASCRPTASAIRRMRGSRGSPLRDPLSLAGQHPFRSSSSAMPTLPRQGPSDGNSQEFRGGSRKFESSSCGVEMLAGGGLSLLWRYAARSAAPFLSRMASPMPGRRHPIKVASQETGANSASLTWRGLSMARFLSTFLAGNSPARWGDATFFVPDLRIRMAPSADGGKVGRLGRRAAA